MTRSIDPAVGAARGEGSLGLGWRTRVLAEQQAALPAGEVLVSCPAPFGSGGLGRHLQEIVEALDRLGCPNQFICEGARMDELAARGLTPAISTAAMSALVAPWA